MCVVLVVQLVYLLLTKQRWQVLDNMLLLLVGWHSPPYIILLVCDFFLVSFFYLDFRLRADEYGRLRNKLSSPIQVARQIVIQQSLSDRFLQAFEEQVLTNGTYRVPSQHMVRKSNR